MSGHTPGPWIFDPENVGSTPHAGYGLYAPDFETGEEFAYVLCSEDKTRKLGEGVPAANARLIAAAPELLEALQELVFASMGFVEEAYLRDACAAIAKAEGR